MWIPADSFRFLVENIPQPDHSPYTAASVAEALRQSGLVAVDVAWVQGAMAVGVVAPDEYGPVILDLFGVASDYFIDPATADRVQRTIKSLQLMRELGYRSVPRMHAYYGDGRPCGWLQPGDPGFDNALRNIRDLELAQDRAAPAEHPRSYATTESQVVQRRRPLPVRMAHRLARWMAGTNRHV